MAPLPQTGTPPPPPIKRSAANASARVGILSKLASGAIDWVRVPKPEIDNYRLEQVRWHGTARDVGVRITTYRDRGDSGDLIITLHEDYPRRKKVAK